MNSLTTWLQSLKPEDYFESSSTSSVYYVISGLKIRLADHFTPKPKDVDLQIICPINCNGIYIVTIKEGLQVLCFQSLKKLADFIHTYSLIHRIKVTSDNMKEEMPVNTKKLAVVNADNRTTKDELWGQVVGYIRVDFPEWDELPKMYKRLCKTLFASKTNYDKCIELMQTVFKAKSYSRESVEAYFEPYINTKVT